jgi:hypothetical protein
MPDFSNEADELLAIHAEFAIAVRYTGAGLTDQDVDAVESDEAATDFLGPGKTLRQTSFEILKDALPSRPGKGDTIVHPDGTHWTVDDIAWRRDIGAWILGVVEVTP